MNHLLDVVIVVSSVDESDEGEEEGIIRYATSQVFRCGVNETKMEHILKGADFIPERRDVYAVLSALFDSIVHAERLGAIDKEGNPAFRR